MDDMAFSGVLASGKQGARWVKAKDDKRSMMQTELFMVIEE